MGGIHQRMWSRCFIASIKHLYNNNVWLTLFLKNFLCYVDVKSYVSSIIWRYDRLSRLGLCLIYKNELYGSSSVCVRSSFDHSTLLVKEREKIILIDVTLCQIDLDKNLNRKIRLWIFCICFTLIFPISYIENNKILIQIHDLAN